MKTHLIYLSVIGFLFWGLYSEIKNQPPEITFTIKQTFKADRILIKFKDKNQLDYAEIFKPEFNSLELLSKFNKKTSSNIIGLGISSKYLIIEHNFIAKWLYLGIILNYSNNYIVNYSDLYIKLNYEY